MDIKLSQPFAPNSAAAPFDVLQVKKGLNRLGYYTPLATTGITDIPDTAVFSALKKFQKDFGLSVTGIINPNDATLRLLNLEISKTPKGHYIWRTVGDNKVRPSHAVLDNTVRSWDESPNPSQDFGCRCWAEYLTEDAIPDYKGWQKEAFDEIKKSENSIPYPYLDTKGYITVGTGININQKEKFMKIEFIIGDKNGKPATLADKEKAYAYLTGFAKEQIAKAPKGTLKPVNQGARFYSDKTNLFFPPSEDIRLYNAHFKETVTRDVPRTFPKFSSLPDPAKIVVTDMMYNMGPTKFTKEKWKNFFKAIDERDWKKAAQESHRKDISKRRNDWAYEQFMSIREK